MLYRTPTHLLTNNGLQFVAKVFEILCGILGFGHLMPTAYHAQTNGQPERYKKKIISRLCHYVAEYQPDWDIYVQPLTYEYNPQINVRRIQRH